MARVDFWEKYISTQNECDKDCKNCLMFLPQRDKCLHQAQKQWEKWNETEHDRFSKVLRGENR